MQRLDVVNLENMLRGIGSYPTILQWLVNSEIHTQITGCSVSVVVGRRTRDREVASSVPGQCIVNSAFHPYGVGKSSTSLLAGVKAGRIHLCRVAGNTV